MTAPPPAAADAAPLLPPLPPRSRLTVQRATADPPEVWIDCSPPPAGCRRLALFGCVGWGAVALPLGLASTVAAVRSGAAGSVAGAVATAQFTVWPLLMIAGPLWLCRGFLLHHRLRAGPEEVRVERHWPAVPSAAWDRVHLTRPGDAAGVEVRPWAETGGHAPLVARVNGRRVVLTPPLSGPDWLWLRAALRAVEAFELDGEDDP